MTREIAAPIEGIPELEYVVITYGNIMETEKGLFLLDSRAYFDEDYFENIEMKFRSQRLLDLCEARDLIVDLVEGFLESVNGNPSLPLYVEDYPLSAANLTINIEFESFFGKYVDPLYMARLKLEDGIVYYYANNAIDPDKVEWHQRVEPYEKAYRFSKFKQMSETGHMQPPSPTKAQLREQLMNERLNR